MKLNKLLLVLCTVALFIGCGKKTEEADPAAAAPAAEPAAAEPAAEPAAKSPADEAKELFATVCFSCHGADGSGNGPAAANLDPKPRNYKDAEWQKNTPDEKIAQAIVEGGPAVGLAAIMPPNPALKEKPEVVAELVKIIRGFGGDAAGGDEAAGDDDEAAAGDDDEAKEE